jgi:hypothetical protein
MAHDWAIVTDLFHRALDEPAASRAAWLDETCGADATLRAQLDSLLAAHAGLDPSDDAPLLAGSVGPYRLVRALGAGGMGVVYLAEDTRLGRQVALKALAPESANDADRRERLRREARAAAALSHPGIATVFALEEIDGALYIVSEFVPGATLREEIAAGPLPAARVINTGIALADALAAAHAHGIVHRDIKPENVMRTPEGVVKILDFGLAHDAANPDRRSAPARLTRDGAILGTPAYMAPEQIRHEAVDARTDLFALGVVLYELASGTHPFADATTAATIGRVLERDAPVVDGPIGPVIARCLAKRPAERFGTASDVRRALEGIRDGRLLLEVGGTGSAQTRAVLKWWEFHQAATAAAYLGLLVPLWYARDAIDRTYGLPLFLVALAAVLAATSLRLHLWFTVRWYPTERIVQERRSRPWVRLADITFVGAIVLMMAATMTSHNRIAVLLVAAAVGVVVSFAIVEPATTRAAFRDP